ncbi:MAG: hypothetical protein ABIA67_02680 [Candidatus Margulisiibacteriota bacterium]
MKKKGFRYIFTKEKAKDYQKLSSEQKLAWLEKMNRFLSAFMPRKSKLFADKLRREAI